MEGVKKAHRERSLAYWNEKFKHGITYQQYSKICRQCIPKDIKSKTIKFEIEADHIFSVKDCWDNKIHPYYASSEKNLRLVKAEVNKAKGSNSLCTLDEFLSMVGVQRLSKAQFNWKQVE